MTKTRTLFFVVFRFVKLVWARIVKNNISLHLNLSPLVSLLHFSIASPKQQQTKAKLEQKKKTKKLKNSQKNTFLASR